MQEEANIFPDDVFRVSDLILKQLQQEELSVEEQKMLDEWKIRSESNRKLFEQFIHGEIKLGSELAIFHRAEKEKAARGDKMMAQNFSGGAIIKQMNGGWRRITVAAAVLVLLVVGVYFWFTREKGHSIVTIESRDERYRNDVPPGKDQAVLKLANGHTIVLDSAANGNLAQQGNTQVMKNGAVLVYAMQGNTSAAHVPEKVLYNTLTTPRGGQFQLSLPDGSKVWLNAASSITFPTAFVEKERKVEITGEVYFEIKKNTDRPFKVTITPLLGGQGAGIEVLGTHFNVSAYDDEAVLKTTLLEGSVKITAGRTQNLPTGQAGAERQNPKSEILKPGQQAQLMNNQLSVINNADTEQEVAWKNGSFHFKNESLETIMRQLARWYDVEVIYQDKKAGIHFGGMISRNTQLTEVLKMLELSNVQFKIEGKKIIVMP